MRRWTLRRTLEQGYRPIGERRYRRKDGSLVDVEIGASVIHDGDREIGCALLRDVTERKRAEAALREIREAERMRIGRDLHDGPLQDLAYGLAEVHIAGLDLADDHPAAAALGRATVALGRVSEGLRSSVNDLRLGGELNSPLPALAEALVERDRLMDSECTISLEVQEGFPSKPVGDAGTEILRVVGEALTNVRRHSGARNVRVSLRAEGDDLVAEVSDDGRGFGPETAPGVGRGSMRERAEALGGTLEVESGRGAGTRVRLRVPLSDVLNGTPQADTIRAKAGADQVNGFGGNDGLSGGDGRDTIRGGDGSDTINAGGGNDRIFVGNDNDRDSVRCGTGNDTVFVGGNGDQADDSCENVERL